MPGEHNADDEPANAPPIRCPAIRDPTQERCTPHQLDALTVRLRDPNPPTSREDFPRGTLRSDGRLDLCKQGLGPEGLRRVLDAMSGSTYVTHLLVGTNALGADGANAIAEHLGEAHAVESLYLGCNAIDAEGAEPLLTQLDVDRTVQAVWFKRNPLGDEGVSRLAATITRNPTIRTVDLVNVGMTTRGLNDLARALTDSDNQVERLYLGGNGLGPECTDHLAALVRDAPSLLGLYLATNPLGDNAISEIADAALSRASGAIALGLGSCGVGPAGAASLAGALHRISGLDLARAPSEAVLHALPNRVGDEGAMHLAASMPASALRRLDLSGNGVSGRGARAILDALRAGAELYQMRFGKGVPRNIKRQIAALLTIESGGSSAGLLIGSVYR